MSVHQLLQKTIYADDFRNKVYSFPVDSVLHTESAPGRLLISVSEGYLLKDPLTNESKQELSLPYRKQVDGSWAARGIVTLLNCEAELSGGLVRLENALAGTTTFTIKSESARSELTRSELTRSEQVGPEPTALERIQKPMLMVDKPELTFPTTSPGTPKFAVLTITQRSGEESVTITSDSPDYFQVASDKHPKFSPTLTLQPAPMGTYVHVRYAADKSGTHHGQLLIQNTQEEQTVTVEGRTTRFLPVRVAQPAYGRPAYIQPERSDSSDIRKKVLLALGSVALLGMVWLGYANRTTLFSSDASDATDKPLITQPKTVPPIVSANKDVSVKPPTSAPTATRRRTRQAPEPTELVVEEQTETPPASNQSAPPPIINAPAPATPQVVQAVTKQPEPVVKSANEVVSKQPNLRAKPKTGEEEESELERELNRSATNQP